MAGSSSARPVLGAYQFTWPNVAAFIVTSTVAMLLHFKGMPFLEALGNTAMLLGLFVVGLSLLRIVDAVRHLRGLRTLRSLTDTLALLANTNSVNPAILNQLLTLTVGGLATGGNGSGGPDAGTDGQSL